MRITVLRGQNQIGGSIVGIASSRAKLVFDVGLNLDSDNQTAPQIEGLFTGVPQYDAVFISHYHPDHLGLSSYLLPSIPLYMGKKCYEVHEFTRRYKEKDYLELDPIFIVPQESIQIEDLQVTPYLCDHSAYDAYMFVIEGEGKKVLYTGDYRANGRKSFEALLHKLPEVDCIITEGTTLNREDIQNLTEVQLEQKADEIIGDHQQVFVLQSSMNIDRLVTVYKAAKKHQLLFLQDLYTAGITSIVGGTIPNPHSFRDVRVFMIENKDEAHDQLLQYGWKRIGIKGIARKPFMMIVRTSFMNYLERLSNEVSFEDAILFYSLWSGYQDQKSMKEFLEFMKGKGVKIVPLHTSGHADARAIDQLIQHTKPRIIVPVHTENAAWFQRYENAVVLLDQASVEV